MEERAQNFFIRTYAKSIRRIQPKKRLNEQGHPNAIVNTPLTELTEKIRNLQLNSTEMVHLYLRRLDSVNGDLNGTIKIFGDESWQEAKQHDQYLRHLNPQSDEYKTLKLTKPLLGIPFTIPHSFELKNQVVLGGLKYRRNVSSAYDDAAVVKLLREAGAIPIAYSNVSAAGLCWDGDSTVQGRSCNPYDLRCITGGSAGGEGALNGSGATPFGVGFDLGGGVRIPAALNGICGLKPTATPNLLNGVFPEFNKEEIKTLGVVGPICRYAKDLALLYSVISSIPTPPEYQCLRPSRLLFYHNIEGPLTRYPHETVVKTVDNALKTLEFQLQLTSAIFKMPYDSQIVAWYSAKLARCAQPNQSITDIFFNRLAKPNMKFEKLKLLLGKSNLTPMALNLVEIEARHKAASNDDVDKALFELEKFKEEIIKELSDDAILICPTLPRTRYLHHEALLHIYDPVYTFIFNLAGLPALTVPMGLDSDGYPSSVQLVGAPGKEWLLISVAEQLERSYGGWRSPQDIPNTPVVSTRRKSSSTPRTTSV